MNTHELASTICISNIRSCYHARLTDQGRKSLRWLNVRLDSDVTLPVASTKPEDNPVAK
jgi:hypothetical protein